MFMKYVSWEYSCERSIQKNLKMEKYALILAVLPRNRLDPVNLGTWAEIKLSYRGSLNITWIFHYYGFTMQLFKRKQRPIISLVNIIPTFNVAKMFWGSSKIS